MVVFKTVMEEVPKSCAKCILWACGFCSLPYGANHDTMLKKYTVRRHPSCDLIKVDDGKDDT